MRVCWWPADRALVAVSVALPLIVVAAWVAGVPAAPVSVIGFQAVAAPSYAVLGAMLRTRGVDPRTARLFRAVALASCVTLAAGLAQGSHAAAVVEFATLPIAPGLLPLILLTFPDGSLASRRWRPAAVLAVLCLLLSGAAQGWAVARSSGVLAGVETAVPADLQPVLFVAGLGWAGTLCCLVLGLTALAVRHRRAGRGAGEVVMQLRIVGLAALLIPVGLIVDFLAGFPADWLVLGAVLPLAVTAAALRYRLYELDAVLNRTAVSLILTALVILAYTTLVGVAGPLLGDVGGIGPAVAAAAVALALSPARHRVQAGVNTLLYGERDDPYGVLSRLARRLELGGTGQASLSGIAGSVADALRLPYVALDVDDPTGPTLAVAHGRPVGRPAVFPMTFQGETVGRLSACPRSEGTTLSPTEQRLLRDLATQAAGAARSLRLARDLHRSREALVRSREEERRRLRRDLHDGVGPALAGMTMQVGAARVMLARDHDTLPQVLTGLETSLQQCIGDIRRLVDDLRPAALDQLGLVGAVASLARDLTGPERSPVIAVVGDELGALPAAVEVAAYRIAAEAMTNAVRHARAGRCTVRLRLGPPIEPRPTLEVLISDDGVGVGPGSGDRSGTDGAGDAGPPAGRRAGVGLLSMRERAEELGGRLELRPAPGRGTVVRAELPLELP